MLLTYVRRFQRGEESERFRKRRSESPHRVMNVDGAERIEPDKMSELPGTGEKIGRQQFVGRKHTWGERDRESWNGNRGKVSRLSDNDEEADRQRLLESLIDPQEVPRSGEYFEVRE